MTTQRIRKEAARWFARMHHAPDHHPDRASFEAWLAADTRHAKEYAGLTGTWQVFDSTPKLQALASRMRERPLLERSTLLVPLCICLVATVLFYQLWLGWQAQPLETQIASTQVGEVRHLALSDGSRLTLNANTRLEVRFYRNARTLQLNHGEVLLEVARDSERPWTVDAGHAQVTVLGTRFVVNRLTDLVRTSVAHGRVRVAAVDAKGEVQPSALVLQDGEVAEVRVNGMPYRVMRPAQDAFGFEHGRIRFDNASLAEIAETLSRYRLRPVTAAQSAQQVEVTAVLQVQSLPAFLALLPRIAPVRVDELSGETRLEMRP